MARDLAKIVSDKKIKFVMFSFVDMFGVLRAKMVPAKAVGTIQKDGAGFAGFAAWLDMTPAYPDMLGMADPDSFMQLPWRPDIGWVACDLVMEGKQVEASPRVMLKRQLEKAGKKGYRTACRQAGLPHQDRRRVRVLPAEPGRHGTVRSVGYPVQTLLRPERADAPG